ncbi:MAG: 1-acyl-sn-glycerol-3-phosphate acyltransferase [Acidimicrobiaceae bacterium]|nr:1-acyl-sn-glycerol-3-phosphate acyltransferase [Acidimicrobiaceae bacterium]
MDYKPEKLKKVISKSIPGFPFKAPTWPSSVSRTPKPSKLGANYDTEWSRTYPVRMVRSLFLDGVARPLIKTLIKPTVYGDDRIKDAPVPVIFAANHSSHLDTPLLASHLPIEYRHKTVIGAGADYFFDRTWKAALWSGLAGAIPIERNRVNRKSSALAETLLNDGWSLIIFPEGGRTPDGFGQTFKAGIGQLAKKSNVPVIPVYIKGTYDALGKNSRKFTPGPTSISFGYPLYLGESEDVRAFALRIQKSVDQLAYELETDWWTARKASALGMIPELAGPESKGWRDEWNRTKYKAAKISGSPHWPKTD